MKSWCRAVCVSLSHVSLASQSHAHSSPWWVGERGRGGGSGAFGGVSGEGMGE